MKKVLPILIIVIVAVGIGVVYFKTNNQSEELEKQMKTASLKYFDDYVSTTDINSVYKVTLKDLQTKNEYEINKLKKCDSDKTYTNITINFKNGKPKKTEVNLKC